MSVAPLPIARTADGREHFSRIGVPVFMADVKGDRSGIAAPGALSPTFEARLAQLQISAPAFAACPVEFGDVFGQSGHPVRATWFGEPMLNLDDLIQTASGGAGVVNVLAADQRMHAPKLHATLLLWLLSELFERLPEVGDPEKPAMVLFFDEAHLLFDDAARRSSSARGSRRRDRGSGRSRRTGRVGGLGTGCSRRRPRARRAAWDRAWDARSCGVSSAGCWVAGADRG